MIEMAHNWCGWLHRRTGGQGHRVRTYRTGVGGAGFESGVGAIAVQLCRGSLCLSRGAESEYGKGNADRMRVNSILLSRSSSSHEMTEFGHSEYTLRLSSADEVRVKYVVVCAGSQIQFTKVLAHTQTPTRHRHVQCVLVQTPVHRQAHGHADARRAPRRRSSLDVHEATSRYTTTIDVTS